MKNNPIVFGLILFTVMPSFSWPQNVKSVPTLGATSSAKGSSAFVANHPSQAPNMRLINTQIRQRMRQIQKDVRAGKLNKDQAQAIRQKLKTVRQQQLEYFRQNGKTDLTNDQKTQLSLKLNPTPNSD